MKAKTISDTQGKIVAMNEALVLGSIRQLELAEAKEKLNELLRAEIVERQQTEEALRRSEERYRTLFNLGPVAVYSIDASGVIQNFNRQAAALWGREPARGDTDERFCGSFKLFRPDGSFMPHDQCPMAEVVSGKIPAAHDAEVQIERPDGSRVTVIINIRPLKNDQGEVIGAINCFYDITARQQAEEALRQSEERYRNLFNSMDEGYCIIEMIFDERGKPVDYRFLEVNRAFEQQSGLHNAPGKRMLEFVSEIESHWLANYGQVALTGQPIRFAKEYKGLNRWFDVYAFPVGGLGIRKVAVLFNDITHRIRNEEALRQAHLLLADRALHLEEAVTERTAELLATNKQLEAFVYSIAHDLRAPLRSMQGFSTLLHEESGPALDEAGRDYAKRICESAQYMDALLIDLLAFSAVSQRRFEPTSVDLQSVLHSALLRFDTQLQETKTRVEIIGPWPKVLAHESTLGQVLSNLINNALKFRRAGVEPHLRLRAEEQGEFLRVWVEDNGIGIAPEHQNRIFGLFTRLNGAAYPGTGVGLAIVQKNIERMLGRTGVESTPAQGSRFWFELWKA